MSYLEKAGQPLLLLQFSSRCQRVAAYFLVQATEMQRIFMATGEQARGKRQEKKINK